MGGEGLTGKVINEIEERGRAAGKETDLGVAGKEGADEKKTTENKGGFGIGFCVPFVECICEREIVYEEKEGAMCTGMRNSQEGKKKANSLEGCGIVTKDIASAVMGG